MEFRGFDFATDVIGQFGVRTCPKRAQQAGNDGHFALHRETPAVIFETPVAVQITAAACLS
jgi:hypothetical protein